MRDCCPGGDRAARRADVSGLRPRLGRLDPIALWPPAGVAVFVGLHRQARVLFRQSLHVRRRLRPSGHADVEHLAVRSVRDPSARWRDHRDCRTVRDLAARPPARRPARRPDRAGPARHLSALLRTHVHQLQGRAVCRDHGACCCWASCARSNNIRTPSPATVALFSIGFGLADRHARAGRLRRHRGARCRCCSSLRVRSRAAWPAARHPANGAVFLCRSSPARSSPTWSWAWSGRGASPRRSIRSARSNISRTFFENPWQRTVRRPAVPRPAHAAQLCADTARATSCRKFFLRSACAALPAPSSRRAARAACRRGARASCLRSPSPHRSPSR